MEKKIFNKENPSIAANWLLPVDVRKHKHCIINWLITNELANGNGILSLKLIQHRIICLRQS